jgi:hypothetical protein
MRSGDGTLNPMRLPVGILVMLLIALAIAACGGLVAPAGGEGAPVDVVTALDGASESPIVPTSTQQVTVRSPTASPAVSVILPTVTPTPIATVAATATPVPAPATAPALPAALSLTGLRHEWQTWNNCGPATLSMALSYFGSPLNQADAGAALRRSPDDKNVSPQELFTFAQLQGMGARLGVNGDETLVKTLLAGGFPVLIETWLEEEANDGMGHYRLIVGYDDERQSWIAYDSYVGTDLVQAEGGAGAPDGAYAGIWLPYAETDALWKVFNRTFLVVFPAEMSERAQTILGDASRPETMWQGAMQRAQAEIDADGGDAFAWFNLGTSTAALGMAGQAASAFDRARELGLPWRMLWYQFEPFVAYNAVGRYGDVVALADQTLATTTSVEEIWYWKGQALSALGDATGARAAFAQAVALNPEYTVAVDALASIDG